MNYLDIQIKHTYFDHGSMRERERERERERDFPVTACVANTTEYIPGNQNLRGNRLVVGGIVCFVAIKTAVPLD